MPHSAVAEEPPNWHLIATGNTVPAGDGFDMDTFAGVSSHLGEFTGEGAHFVNPITGAGGGCATYTAANGDTLDLTYTAQIVGIDPTAEFPISFVGEFTIVGGTGRFEHATGSAVGTGGFTDFAPADFFFELEGTLHPQGK